jgi:hypothetical protein
MLCTLIIHPFFNINSLTEENLVPPFIFTYCNSVLAGDVTIANSTQIENKLRNLLSGQPNWQNDGCRQPAIWSVGPQTLEGKTIVFLMWLTGRYQRHNVTPWCFEGDKLFQTFLQLYYNYSFFMTRQKEEIGIFHTILQQTPLKNSITRMLNDLHHSLVCNYHYHHHSI